MNTSKLWSYCGLLVLVSLLQACEKSAEQSLTEPSSAEQPLIVVEDAFIYELPPNQIRAAAYMRLTNNSDKMQALNYIHSPVAENVEVHRMFYQDGMMQMRPVQRLKLNPGESKQLESGGFHLMIMGVYEPFKAGDHFDITLEFETGHVVTVPVEVRSPG